MANIQVNLNVFDLEPVNIIMDIVMQMLSDDRVPMEYKTKIWEVMRGYLG